EQCLGFLPGREVRRGLEQLPEQRECLAIASCCGQCRRQVVIHFGVIRHGGRSLPQQGKRALVLAFLQEYPSERVGNCRKLRGDLARTLSRSSRSAVTALLINPCQIVERGRR